MKKFIILVVFFIIMCLFSYNKYDLTNDAIRFRVISNSNSIEDIRMKENVVKEVSNIIKVQGKKDEVRNTLINSIPIIESKIDSLFINNNYDKSYNVIYGMNEFPEKEYNSVIYPSGEYESLVIKIGESNGDNYWCFLYPSLCMINNSEDNSYNVVYEFKIFNFLGNLFM